MGFRATDTDIAELQRKGLIAGEQEPARPISEEQFQSEVIAFAKRQGWRVYHTRDSRRSEKGFPDLVLIRGKELIVAELKAGKNVTTMEQEEWLAAFAKTGAVAALWYPHCWPTIERLLR